jgi:hypothetical protein
MKLIPTIIVYGGFGAMMGICGIGITNWRYWVLFVFLLGAEYLGSVEHN